MKLIAYLLTFVLLCGCSAAETPSPAGLPEDAEFEEITPTPAPEQEEIKRIRDKYLPKEENKMEQLQRLDASATKKGTAVALIVGIIGTLMLAA